MGTRGRYVFKFLKKYYVFYNQFDSYFSGIGDMIVKELANYKLEDFEKMKAKLSIIKRSDINDGSGSDFEGVMCALENPDKYRLIEITNCEPDNDSDIEYIYILDLDHDIFKVKYIGYDNCIDCNRFRLSAIPRDWMDFVRDPEDSEDLEDSEDPEDSEN
jgi:hypothetical protein